MLLAPISYRLWRKTELARKLVEVTPGASQLDDLVPELGRVRTGMFSHWVDLLG
jgi:hypothetical protein